MGTVDDAGPRMVGDKPALELLLLPDNVPCEGGGVVAVVLAVGGLVDGGVVVGAVVVGAVVGAADVLGAVVVDLTAAAWVAGLELEVHDVEEAFGCVFAGALLLDAGGSGLAVLLLGSALTLVLTPLPGLELSVPVSGLVGVASGVGDGLEETDGLGFTEAGVDELVLAAAAVDETDPADWVDAHDDVAPAGAVGNPAADVPVKVPGPPVERPAGGGLVALGVEFDEARPVATAIPWRSGGMAARMTPTANTAIPTARAGRSIASRQSLGRCGARCGCLGSSCPPGTACPRPTRPARNPAMARRKAASRGNLAVA